MPPACLRNTIVGLLTMIVVLCASASSFAQETLRLSESDTWESTSDVDPASPEGQLQTARRTLAAGNSERAEFLATQWIERHGEHPLLPSAYVLRGDALKADRSYYAALFDYELVARRYTGSEAFVTAIERELEIAKQFASGTRRKLWGMRIISAADEAEELLIRIQERMPGSLVAEEAAMTLANFYFEKRSMELAAEMYAIFVENFPRSERVGIARRRLIYCNLASFKGPEFDASGLYEARARLRALKRTEPAVAQQIGADALLTRIEESDAHKMLTTAEWYVKIDDLVAAELTIRRLLRRYPRSVAAAHGARLMAQKLEALPPAIRAEAPDYAAIDAILRGAEPDDTAPAEEGTDP